MLGNGFGGRELTFHETLLDNLAETLHVGLGEVLALLGLFQPFVGPCALCKTRWPRLRDIAVFGHVLCVRYSQEQAGNGQRATMGARRGRSCDGGVAEAGRCEGRGYQSLL